jgi:hypothetical protein
MHKKVQNSTENKITTNSTMNDGNSIFWMLKIFRRHKTFSKIKQIRTNRSKSVFLGSPPPAQPFSNSALAQLSPFFKTAPNSALTQLSPRPTQPFLFPTQPYVFPTQPLPNSALS